MAKSEKQKNLQLELATQMLTLATSGFGLVAALAWNEAIQALVKEFIEPRVPGSGLLSKVIYAVLITGLAVFITFQLSRISARFQQSKK